MGSVLVLDLDETLLSAICYTEIGFSPREKQKWRQHCMQVTQKCRNYWPNLLSTRSNNYFMFVRPYAVQFLQYCRKVFDFLVIFTAGTKSHAAHIHTHIFQQQASVTADFVFDRENCGKFASNSSQQENVCGTSKTILAPHQKNLCHLREQVEQRASTEQLQKIDWSDCLFVDDLATHVANNCGEMLLVPKFDYPCLRNMLSPQIVENEAAMLEASRDDTLRKLSLFIQAKRSSTTGHCWQQVDKRFALFS